LITALAALLAVSLTLPAASIAAPTETPTDANPPSETSPVMPNIAELQEKVEEASAVYDDANRRIAAIETQISETGERISAVSRQIPEAKKKSGRAAAEYYRLMSTSNMFLDLLFCATTLDEFTSNLEYTVRMNQAYLKDINLLSSLNAELEVARAKLEDDKQSLESERLRAEEALTDAQYARNVAEETALRIAEQTAAATAAAAAAAEAAAQPPQTPLVPTPDQSEGDAGAGSGGAGTGPGTELPGDNQATDKQTFVNQWSGRIDAYLSGSPLAGTGWIFANAAWDYNVDPRWSPAIACLESSKGRYCFKEHNAWGWGSSSWPDWETAIYAHVSGLSRGYGYTISEAAAKKYCPPNWKHWYDFVSSQMKLI
jgi:peptidoglycan hydrolase CwlO-like protein